MEIYFASFKILMLITETIINRWKQSNYLDNYTNFVNGWHTVITLTLFTDGIHVQLVLGGGGRGGEGGWLC